jgi:lipopolysaccharide export system protein LptA
MSRRYSINHSEALQSEEPKRPAPGSRSPFSPSALKLFGLLMFCFFLLIETPLRAEVESKKAMDPKGPTVITASRLLADSNANTALFEGSVVAKNNEMTLYSDRMKVYYTKDNSIERIDAGGNVKLVKDNRVVTSEEATYFASEQKIIFVGNPRAIEGQNVVIGSKMTYLIEEDRSIVEESKVFLKQKPSAKKEK